MKGNLTKAAGLFQAPLSQMARLAEALKEKKPAERGGRGCAAEAPADGPVRRHPGGPPTGRGDAAAETTDTHHPAADAASDD